MYRYKRVFLIVMDSLGIGAMPDSDKFGDFGVDTLGHIAEKMDSFTIPNLRRLGMANLHLCKMFLHQGADCFSLIVADLKEQSSAFS